MKKKLIAAFIAGAAVNVIAAEIPEANLQWAREHFEKQGVPIPDGGITVRPLSTMKGYAEGQDERNKIKKQVAKLGYAEQYNERAEFLQNIDNITKEAYKNQTVSFNAESDDLKHSIDEIKMAYTFVPVSQSDTEKVYGFAPYLTYIKGQGWVGVMEYFKSKFANCAYSENNVKLSHGAIVIAEEDAKNLVNGKVTIVEAVGNEQSGFVYNVEWFDQTFFRKLECASKTFDKDGLNKTIELAKSIDKL